jgi:hypothetical protein
VTRRGAPEGAHAAAGQDDSRKDTAIEEATHWVRAAIRLQAHGMTSGEIPSNELTEAQMRLLARADDWLTVAGTHDAE